MYTLTNKPSPPHKVRLTEVENLVVWWFLSSIELSLFTSSKINRWNTGGISRSSSPTLTDALAVVSILTRPLDKSLSENDDISLSCGASCRRRTGFPCSSSHMERSNTYCCCYRALHNNHGAPQMDGGVFTFGPKLKISGSSCSPDISPWLSLNKLSKW